MMELTREGAIDLLHTQMDKAMVRKNVARIRAAIRLMTALRADKITPSEVVDTLLEWHTIDLVDQLKKERQCRDSAFSTLSCYLRE